MRIQSRLSRGTLCVSICLWLLLAACTETPEETTNEEAVTAPTQVEIASEEMTGSETETAVEEPAIVEEVAQLEPTSTFPPTIQAPATFTPQPTATEIPATDTPPPPTETAVPTETPTIPTNTPPPPTATAVSATSTTAPPANTAVPPTVPPNPVLAGNILPNGSFEEGWYHTHGIGELQTPNNWVFEWDEGPTGYGDQSWDVWVRPEMRVLSTNFLPPAEHDLFIFEGGQTVKVFKGSGAISFRIFQDIALQPGTYVFEVKVFPDLYTGYDGGKIWATDPLAGEIRFITPDGGTGWLSPAPGTRNTFTHAFTITDAQTIRIGIGIRGRYAIANNGWFIDDWSLQQVQN